MPELSLLWKPCCNLTKQYSTNQGQSVTPVESSMATANASRLVNEWSLLTFMGNRYHPILGPEPITFCWAITSYSLGGLLGKKLFFLPILNTSASTCTNLHSSWLINFSLPLSAVQLQLNITQIFPFSYCHIYPKIYTLFICPISNRPHDRGTPYLPPPY